MPGEAIKAVAVVKPDLVLIVLKLSDKNSLQLIQKIKKAHSNVRILVISAHSETRFANRALRAGADGYIIQKEEPDEFLVAMRDVLSGHMYISDEVF